jgi:hypothetical protein
MNAVNKKKATPRRATRATMYQVSNLALRQKSFLESQDCIPGALKRYVGCLLSLAEEKHQNVDGWDGEITRAELVARLQAEDLSSAPATVSKNDSMLVTAGALEVLKEHRGSKRVTVKRVMGFEAMTAYYKDTARDERRKRLRQSDIDSQIAMFSLSDDVEYLRGVDGPTGVIDGLFHGVLDACVRLSSNDPRRVIETYYKFNSRDGINIKTKTLSGEENAIIIASDFRVVRALSGMFMKYVHERYGSKWDKAVVERDVMTQPFVFDIDDLCFEIFGVRGKGGYRRQAELILDRIRTTVFDIHGDGSDYFRTNFSFTSGQFMEARFLVEFYAQPVEANQANRFFAVKFHTVFLKSLLHQKYVAHRELNRERSGIAHRLATWGKIKIGVRPSAEHPRGKTYFLDELKNSVAPSALMGNFQRDFIELLKRECVDQWDEAGVNLSRIYGYFYEIDFRQESILARMKMLGRKRKGRKLYPVVRVFRDVDDYIVGDDSPHNRAIGREVAAGAGLLPHG